MKLTDVALGTVLFWGPNEDGSQALVISEDRHDECGWPERITYIDRDTLEVVRSGCAGCEAERPFPAGYIIGAHPETRDSQEES